MESPFPDRSDPAWQQIRAERATAAPHMRRFEPRLVFEALWSFGGWALVGAAGVAGWVPYWVSVPIASIFVFTAYMPLHEATHGNVHGRYGKLHWLNQLVGHLSSIPLMFDFRGHQIVHMKHHAHTNEVGKDPDLIFAGPYLTVLRRSVILLTIGYLLTLVSWLPPVRRHLLRPMQEGLGTDAGLRVFIYGRRFQTLTFLTMLAIALAGYPLEVLMFWFLPSRLGSLITSTVFAWLPHHPHNGYGRYTNTRITLFPLSGLLGRGHERHLIHHMIPLIPHYRIREVFEKLRPVLEERGARIEGPGAGPGAAKIMLGWDDGQVAAIERNAASADARPFT